MKLYNHTFHAMGTRCETQLYAASPEAAACAAAVVQTVGDMDVAIRALQGRIHGRV